MKGIKQEDYDDRSRLLSSNQPSTSYQATQRGLGSADYSDLSSSTLTRTENMRCNNESTEKCMASCKDQLCGPANPVTRYCQNFFTVDNAKRKFPFVKWAPQYRLKHFVGDLVAGLTVGLTVIPQGMAYAQIAELPAQYGLYSAFVGGFIYCLFGTSKDITMGPTAIMSLLVAEFASEKAPTHEDAPTYAIALTLICGLLQMAMGLLNLGFVVQFISFPVISGFTSSAAILIAFSQVKKWLGLNDVPRAFIPQVKATFSKIPETNLWDMTMGLVCIVILVCMKKLKEYVDPKLKMELPKFKKIVYKFAWLLCTARNAVVVIVCAGFASILVDIYGFKVGGNSFLTLTGNVRSGIPSPSPPTFYIHHFNNDTQTSITKGPGDIFSDIGEGFVVVTLIGLLESIAIAKTFARRNEYKIDANQELIAMGISNSISSFFHSYPITGSFSRTAINSQSGARTPANGIWTGLTVLLAIAVLTPYFYYIPQATLAAVIICAVIPMVEYEVIPKLFKVKKADLFPLFITFIVCLLVNIEFGIISGVGFSLLMLVYPMSRPELTIRHEKSLDVEALPNDETINSPREVVIIEPNQGLKFPGIEYIKDKVMKHGVYEEPAKAIILNAQHFAGCDYTTVQGITQVSEYFNKHNLQFIIVCPSDEVRLILDKAEIKGLQFSDSVEEGMRVAFAGGQDLSSHTRNVNSGKLNEAFTVEINSSDDNASSSSVTESDQQV